MLLFLEGISPLRFFSVINSLLLMTFVHDDDGLYIVGTAQSAHTGVTHASNIIFK